MLSRRWSVAAVAIGMVMMTTPWWLRWGTTAWAKGLTAKAPHPMVLAQVAHGAAAPLMIPAPPTAPAALGTVLGSLTIPALGLRTAFVQGTSNTLLLQSPGHYSGSVLPGADGTSVISGHNVTFFRHLGRLSQGALIRVTTAQGRFVFRVVSHHVVSDRAPVLNTAFPSLDLVACYPLNALYFTSRRYVVQAKLVRDALSLHTVTTDPAAFVPYRAQMAPTVARQFRLSLAFNSVPMGHLGYIVPQMTPAVARFERSSGSLEVEVGAIRLWDAAWKASQAGLPEDVTSLFAHGAAPPQVNPYWRAASILFEGRLNVAVAVNAKGHPDQVLLTDPLVRIDGTPWKVSMTIGIGAQNELVQRLIFTPWP